MIVNRIVIYQDQRDKEVTIKKSINPDEIVSFEEFTTGVEKRKAVYVYAKTHEFVVDSDFNTFDEQLRMAKLTD